MKTQIDPHREPMHRYPIFVFMDSLAWALNRIRHEDRQAFLKEFRDQSAWHRTHQTLPKRTSVTFSDLLQIFAEAVKRFEDASG